ncbi:P-loop containing nucleoside triphosphate hydrolase protein [Hygrophoropsis aurantiaca]|uniref:P-loop containing nucleoside triphosphate hydrolase protein n=1 Tax=Hygrophoropsis aurantiaca TaxID=72124 RepID=A0ACB8ANR9_9AGAM|nr:P-loop containing nucleoside triphosphate hydrolase protein [Hygrophoropsis aurantiaca]
MITKNEPKRRQWKPERTDINILILGLTGAGKSTFINAAIGGREIAVVGHGLESCTKDPQPFTFPKPDEPTRRIVLVDTPGFDDTYAEKTDTVNQIGNWLKMLLENDAKIAGVIYLHDISQGRSVTTDSAWKTTQEICGQDAFKNMIMATTKWRLPPGSAELERRREKELSDIVWKDARERGSRIARFDGTQESARQIISLAARKPLITPLQLERDLKQGRDGNIKHNTEQRVGGPHKSKGFFARLFRF